MKLIVFEIGTLPFATQQRLSTPKPVIVEAVRPHLYIHNFPAGSLQLEIRDDTDTQVAVSDIVDISDITSASFYHGYVRFNINAYLEKDRPYFFRVQGVNGYEFSEISYVGWCSGYDLGKYSAIYTVANNFKEPLDLEVWTRSP